MLDCARALVPPDRADCLIGHPPNTAAGPRSVAVPLGRPGQRGRARADAAQPAQRRDPVPRLVRRRGGPRVRRAAGRRQHRARRLLGAVLGSVRSVGGDRGVAGDRRQRVRGRCAGGAPARAPVGCAARIVFVEHRLAGAARSRGGPSSNGSSRTSPTSRSGGAAPSPASPTTRRCWSRRSAASDRRQARRTRIAPPPVFGYTVVQLNREFMVGNVLPALSRRFFIHSEGDSYRVAVVQHQPAGGRDLPVGPGDAGAPRFGRRHRDVLRTARAGVLLRPSRRGGRRAGGGPRFPRRRRRPIRRTGPAGPAAEPRSLAGGRAARQRLAGGGRRQRAPPQSGHQLRRAAPALGQRGAAGPGVAARAAAGAPADGVRGRRLARAAHADRRDPLGRREPVARRRRRKRPREAVRPGDGGRGAPPRRDGGKRAAVRGRRIGAGSRAASAARAGRPDRSGGRVGPRQREQHGRGRARRSRPTFPPCSAIRRR